MTDNLEATAAEAKEAEAKATAAEAKAAAEAKEAEVKAAEAKEAEVKAAEAKEAEAKAAEAKEAEAKEAEAKAKATAEAKAKTATGSHTHGALCDVLQHQDRLLARDGWFALGRSTAFLVVVAGLLILGGWYLPPWLQTRQILASAEQAREFHHRLTTIELERERASEARWNELRHLSEAFGCDEAPARCTRPCEALRDAEVRAAAAVNGSTPTVATSGECR